MFAVLASNLLVVLMDFDIKRYDVLKSRLGIHFAEGNPIQWHISFDSSSLLQQWQTHQSSVDGQPAAVVPSPW